FQQHILDLSKVELLAIETTEWTMDTLVLFINESMPRLSHMKINHLLWTKSCPVNVIPLFNIRTLEILYLSKSHHDEKINWTQLFPRVERLIIDVNTCRQMAILIDRFEYLSNGLSATHIAQAFIYGPVIMTKN
ncbi:unnamed protein product, partial [Rotaria sp. Silwood2]